VGLVGRRRERREIEDLLERAARGSGGVLAIVGPAGAGKTALADEAAANAREQGFEVLRAAPARTQPGRLVWAQLLRDTGASDADATGLLTDPGPMELDSAAKQLTSGVRRLIVVDDVDHGGQQAVELLSTIAGRVVAGSTAVIVTSTTPIGVGRDLTLRGLTEDELAAVIPDATHALWVASRGLPGVARALAAELSEDGDPIVQLALRAVATAGFLVVDVELIRLLELAVSRATDGATKARVLARLAYELLADATAGARRRELADDALELARQVGDKRVLAEVLDARLHALWEPDGVRDRLDIGQEVVELARAAGDDTLERKGMFWRFVALMELGRVSEAESVLAAYENAVVAAGDGQGFAMATARHGMLAALRGRFDEVDRIAEEVTELGRRSGLADTYRLVGALRGPVMSERDIPGMVEVERAMREWSRRLPGHFAEADLARILALIGRESAADAEVERIVPQVLAGSGPRWIGALSHLAFAAATTGNLVACTDIYRALNGYAGRLVVLGGANSSWGPVDHYLGLLAARLGSPEDAVEHFKAAIGLEEEIGALPYLAHTLAACADVTGSDTHRQRARSIAERLGMTVLLDRLARPADEWRLERDGDDWVLTAGDEAARLRESRGLHYLRALLAAPGKEIPALDLVAGGAGLVATGTGPVIDDAARAAYRARLSTLDAELDAADRAGDRELGARLEDERQAVLVELRRASGLGGRARPSTTEAERARVNVTRTLRAAMDRISASAPRTGAHLQASVRTGLACRYEPAPGGPPRWHV
jgi:hypothetical protein